MQRFQWVLMILAMSILSPMAGAQGDATLPVAMPPSVVGTVTNVQGSLSVSKAGAAPRTLAVYDNVAEGEVLSTAAGAYARVKFVDGGELILRPNSQAEITRYTYKAATPASDSAIITLLKGGLRSLTGLMGKRNPQQISFKTQAATIGIRGTDIGLRDCKNDCDDVSPPGHKPSPGHKPPPNGTHVEVTHGLVSVKTAKGMLLVKAGQFAHVKNSASRPQLVSWNKGVRVIVPPSIRTNPPPKHPGGEGGASQHRPLEGAEKKGEWSAPSTLGNSSDLGSDISKLPATAAGPTQQPTNEGAGQSRGNTFGASPVSSFGGGGGGGRAASRN